MSNSDNLVKQRLARIESRKKIIGSQEDRMLRKYSPNFLQIFNFFLRLYRANILTFSGGIVTIVNNSLGPNKEHETHGKIADAWIIPDIKASDALFAIREFENGRFKRTQTEPAKILTKHPNIVRAFIQAKKSWGLCVAEWAEGIADGLFLKVEILHIFTANGIGIPLENIEQLGSIGEEFTSGFQLFMPKPFYTELSNAIWKERFKRKDDDLMGDFIRELYAVAERGKVSELD